MAKLSSLLWWVIGIIGFGTPGQVVLAQDCQATCTGKYNASDVLKSSCTTLCTTQPTFFDVNYPYLLGPLPMKPYPELTGAPVAELNAAFSNSKNQMYVRVNADRNKIQFYLDMVDNPEPYFPYFAMHLHQGNLVKGEIGGHILVHIAGAGDIVSCVAITRKIRTDNRLNVCSTLCTPENHELDNCINPKRYLLASRRCPLCNKVLVGAYHCKGGCQGDRRIKGNTIKGPTGRSSVQKIAPSRKCDIGNPNKPSNAKQRQWIQGLYSHEFSGNETDGKEYSKWSIGIPENYDFWCKDTIPFLVDDIFKSGAAAYVALHVNFNATGLPTLVYGDVFTAVSTSSGGPQSCTIFGNSSLPCSAGVSNLLNPLNAS